MAETKPGNDESIGQPKVNSRKIFHALFFLAAVFVLFTLGYLFGQWYAPGDAYICPECPEYKSDVPDAVTSNPGYSSYEPPLHPAYTQGWKLYISEKNNILFLYPPDFSLENNSDAVHVPIILKNPQTGSEIMVQRLEDLTNFQKSTEFDKFLEEINSGTQIEKYGFLMNPDDSSDSGNLARSEYVKEINLATKKIYYSQYFRHEGWPEVIVIRAHNLESDDLRAIKESFKFIRE